MGERIYHLDLPALVEGLGQQSATLITPVRSRVPGINGPCQGMAQVVAGHVVHCAIHTPHGVQIEGEQALQLLRPVQSWQVMVDGEQREQLPPPPPLPTLEWVPRRRVTWLPLDRLHGVSVKERLILGTVFALIDGRRGISQIQVEGHVPEKTLAWAIHVLFQLHALDPA